MTQDLLASKAGVEPKTISEIETGKRPTPRPETLSKLDRALDSGGQLVEVAEREAAARAASGDDAEPPWLAGVYSRFDSIEGALNEGLLVSYPSPLPGEQPPWLVELIEAALQLNDSDREVLLSLARRLRPS